MAGRGKNLEFKRGYYYENGRWKPSKSTRSKWRKERQNSRILDVWNSEKHPYSYDSPPLSAFSARQRGMDVYWAICKHGHVGERSLKKSQCKTCAKISRSIRNAKTRGALKVALSREEKDQIAALYEQAQSKTLDTGKQYHVDHIRPLAAGGLHHPNNLRVMLAEENLAKGALYKGKRRKYSRKEKIAARAEFKSQLGEAQKITKIESHDLSLIIGGAVFGPILLFYAVFGDTSRKEWESVGIGCALNLLIILFVF